MSQGKYLRLDLLLIKYDLFVQKKTYDIYVYKNVKLSLSLISFIKHRIEIVKSNMQNADNIMNLLFMFEKNI